LLDDGFFVGAERGEESEQEEGERGWIHAVILMEVR
jgi:hypothetical protein